MKAFDKHMGSYTEDSSKMGWLVSILELGAWLGTIYSGFLAEIISRKYAILVNTGIFILGVIIQATAITGTGHNSILGGRFITGTFVHLGKAQLARLTRQRHGCRILEYDRTNVQRGVRTSRGPWSYGRYATDGYHYWHHDCFLDRLWWVLPLYAYTTSKLIQYDIGTNYIGGTGETQSDAAWLIPLCLQLFPAVILFVGMIFMVIKLLSMICASPLTYW
jgi:hypothetical protein